MNIGRVFDSEERLIGWQDGARVRVCVCRKIKCELVVQPRRIKKGSPGVEKKQNSSK